MLNSLVTILLTGTVAAGGFGAYNHMNNAEVKELKIEAVEGLSQTDKDFILSMQDKSMRDLTVDEKMELREINEKVREYIIENVTDADLKEQLQSHAKIAEHFRATRKMSDEERNAYMEKLTEEEKALLLERIENHPGRQYRNK